MSISPGTTVVIVVQTYKGKHMNQMKFSIINGFKNWTNFKGRATRSEYWLFLLSLYVFAFILTLISPDPGLGGIVYLIYIVPLTAVAVRRMHDSGHSGWWTLCPIVNFVFLCTGTEGSMNSYGPPQPPIA